MLLVIKKIYFLHLRRRFRKETFTEQVDDYETCFQSSFFILYPHTFAFIQSQCSDFYILYSVMFEGGVYVLMRCKKYNIVRKSLLTVTTRFPCSGSLFVFCFNPLSPLGAGLWTTHIVVPKMSSRRHSNMTVS